MTIISITLLELMFVITTSVVLTLVGTFFARLACQKVGKPAEPKYGSLTLGDLDPSDYGTVESPSPIRWPVRERQDGI